MFLLVGLAFKIGAVPFHMWTPDVYEGAPTPVTAFFAAAPKLAAMALLVRTLLQGFPGIAAQWQQIIVFLSIASMLLGAFAAIGQRNIKRLMAYSSIGHIGYALIGLAAYSEAGTQSVLVYLAIYLAMTVGTFACILSMRTAEGPVEDIDALSGLAKTNLPMAFVLAMLLFSMAGIPPLAGFFAKLYVFGAAIKANLVTLAVIGVLASVVGAYYYLRLVKIMFFDDAKAAFLPVERGAGFVMTLSGAFVLLFVLGAGAARQCGADRGARAARRYHRRRPMTRRAGELAGGLPACRTSSRSTAPMRRPCAACWPASAARCGSWRSGRRRAAAAPVAPGRRSPATSLPASSPRSTARRRRRGSFRSLPASPSSMPSGGRETSPVCVSNGRTTFLSARRRRAASSLKVPRGRRNRGTIAVIGVGLNLVSAPDDLGRAATFLANHALALSPREALCFLAQTMSDWIGIWNNGEGFAPVREAWLARAGSLGEVLTVNAAGGPVTGIVCRYRRQRRAAHRRRRRPPAQLHLRRRFASPRKIPAHEPAAAKCRPRLRRR